MDDAEVPAVQADAEVVEQNIAHEPDRTGAIDDGRLIRSIAEED